MAVGTVKSVHVEKGFGFIGRPNEGDVFFHCRELNGLDFDEGALIGAALTIAVDLEHDEAIRRDVWRDAIAHGATLVRDRHCQ